MKLLNAAIILIFVLLFNSCGTNPETSSPDSHAISNSSVSVNKINGEWQIVYEESTDNNGEFRSGGASLRLEPENQVRLKIEDNRLTVYASCRDRTTNELIPISTTSSITQTNSTITITEPSVSHHRCSHTFHLEAETIRYQFNTNNQLELIFERNGRQGLMRLDRV